MSTITLHQVAYRDGRPVARSVTASMGSLFPKPDLYSTEPSVAEAKLARLALLSGAWRRSPKTGGIDAKGDYLLSLKTPMAMLFPAPARHALLRRPPTRGCHWCVARFLAALDGQPEPTPTDPLRAFIGKPCATCTHRHVLIVRLQEVRAEFAAEVASGRTRRPLVASADARQPRGMNSQDPQLLHAVPTPRYYRRRPWPGQAARQPGSAWNGPTLRRSVVPRGRPR